MKIKDILHNYHRLLIAADICRFKKITHEQVIAVIRFLDERSKVVNSIYNGKQKRIVSGAAFDYAFNTKNRDDEADLFECCEE
jgi:hypothetical protein